MAIISRGSLSQIKNGGTNIENISEEENQWLKQVYASFMTIGDSFGIENYTEDLNILNLWGIYNDNCPTKRREFNDKYFSPLGR
jgi:hypothetical protein